MHVLLFHTMILPHLVQNSLIDCLKPKTFFDPHFGGNDINRYGATQRILTN